MEIENEDQQQQHIYKSNLNKNKKSLAKICKVKNINKSTIDNIFNPVKKIRKLSNSSMTTQGSSYTEELSQLGQMSYILADFREISQASCSHAFLLRHNILPIHYAKMIDWLAQINSVFNSPVLTLFLGIDLMQRYFDKVQQIQNLKDLHLSGIVCWYIASKFEDIYPLDIEMARQKLGNNEFTIEQIQEKEIDILEVLNYQLLSPNIFTYCCAVMKELNLEQEVGVMVAELVNQAVTFVALMSQCEYKIQKGNQLSEMVSAVLQTALQIVTIKVRLPCEQIQKLVQTINQLTGSTNKPNCLQEIQLLTKNFGQLHIGLKYVEGFGKTLIEQLKEMKREEMKVSL